MKQITSQAMEISAPVDAVWARIADIEGSAQVISGIKSVRVIEPATGPGPVGLKWQETREFMGKDATETMWVTDAQEPVFYQTRAESHGAVYVSRLELTPTPDGTRLTMSFSCKPETFGARAMWLLTGWMAKRSLAKTIDQDLQDIKAAVEEA